MFAAILRVQKKELARRYCGKQTLRTRPNHIRGINYEHAPGVALLGTFKHDTINSDRDKTKKDP